MGSLGASPSLNHFRHVVVDDALPPPTEGEIKRLESEVGATLPDDFRRFLDVANGGELADYSILVTHSGGDELMGFSSVYATRPAPGRITFERALRNERARKNIPEGVLPIAYDAGDSILFMDLSGDAGGRIVAFVHELPDWTGRGRSDAYVEVAPSFGEYVDQLQIETQYAQESIDRAWSGSDTSAAVAVAEWLDIGMPDWRTRLNVPDGFAVRGS